jgi:integrase
MSNVMPLRKPAHGEWPEVLEAFLLWRRATGLSERTLSDYRYHVGRFFTEHPGTWQSEQLNKAVYRYLGEPMAPASFNIRRKYLKGFFDWVFQEGIIYRNPIEGIKVRRAEPRIVRISPETLQRLLEALNQKTFAGLRDKGLILLQLDAGIRPGEALSLMPKDYVQESLEVRIRAEVSKTRTTRTLFVSPPCADILSRLLTVRLPEWKDAPLFCNETGQPYSVNSWGNRLRKFSLRKLGIQISPYDLRHCHALLFLRNNGNIFALQKEMGHSDLEMTKRYLALSDEDVRKAHTEANPLRGILNSSGQKRLRRIN